MTALAWITVSLIAAGLPQISEFDVFERFELFNECERMRLIVEGVSEDAVEFDLTDERIRVAAESRLRAARLYTDGVSAPYLYVRVSVNGSAFYIEVSYKKFLFDSASGVPGYAQSWNVGGIGTHGRDSGFVLQAVSEYVDGFILEYLRVNEDACE